MTRLNIEEAIKLNNYNFYRKIREYGIEHDCVVRKSNEYMVLYPDRNKKYNTAWDIIKEIVGADVVDIIKNKIEFISWEVNEEGTATHVRFKFV